MSDENRPNKQVPTQQGSQPTSGETALQTRQEHRNQLRGVTHEWKKPGNEHFVQNKELQQDKERNMPMQNDLSRTTNFVPHIPPQGDRYFKMDHR